ncbi:hypothetical protein ACFSC6_02020 [Rufibacter sediminis]|uniref:Uncharacterized protein n=1 Tax=Rufibacter sediminis TaxID=2762756 RepID=A0ABR6VWS1_9BACT|nr:hypothetical protein [Rufibacter sediminis]MBC3541651.1 hypothetical protein [Rufibacter sediminis]
MKKLVFLFLFCGSYLQASAQTPKVVPFVLGLVDDSKGRAWVKDHPQESTLVDKFHSTENNLVTYVDSLIKEENKRTYDKVIASVSTWEKKDCFYCREFKRIQSKKLVEHMNEAYSFKWKDEVDENNYKIYRGVLKPKAFPEDLEKYSFLAGAYVRYGNQEEEKYSLKLNSKSKFDAILRELKALRCDILKVDIKDGETATQLITFLPTPKLKAYLDKQEPLRLAIQKKKEKFFQERKNSGLFSTAEEEQQN